MTTEDEDTQKMTSNDHDDPDSIESDEDEVDDDLEYILHVVKAILELPAIHEMTKALSRLCESHATIQHRELKLDCEIAKDNAKFRFRGQWMFLIALATCLLFLVYVLWLFKDNSDTLLPVLTAVVGLLAGVGGGAIFGNRSSESRRSIR